MMMHARPDPQHLQWRIDTMNNRFGAYGVKWRYEIVDTWTEPGVVNDVRFFVQVNLYVRDNAEDKWGYPIPGVGGRALIEKREGDPHSSALTPEMALADALSVAMTALGASSTD